MLRWPHLLLPRNDHNFMSTLHNKLLMNNSKAEFDFTFQSIGIIDRFFDIFVLGLFEEDLTSSSLLKSI